MLFEKNTLFGLLVLWFTGCSAVSPGHLPFWARASISVPGAPTSSLLTGSQVLVLNPGVEIWAPVWVATALLCTAQPAAPRFETSLAPVPDGGLAAATAAVRACAPAPAAVNELACAADARPSSVMTEMAAAQRAGFERGRDLMTGDSCRGPIALTMPPLNTQLVRILSEQTCQ